MKIDCLIRIAILHYQFEAIHPFYDGNGRTGRILMVLQMVLERRLRYPVLFLSGYILENKVRYYKLLKAVTEEGRWIEWVEFILEGIEVQAKETSLRIVRMRDLRVEFIEKFKKLLPKIYYAELADYIFSKGFYSRNDMSDSLNIEIKTAGKYLELMLERGLVEKKKVGREFLYFIPELLKVLS